MCICRDIDENVLEIIVERLEKVNVNGEYMSQAALNRLSLSMRYASSEQHMNITTKTSEEENERRQRKRKAVA